MSLLEDPGISALTRFLDANVLRSELVMSNMANIDTPNYKTRDLDFNRELQRAGGLEYASFAPGVHLVQGLMERPDGNNVSLERESLLLADTQMRFNLGVQVLRDRFKTLLSAIHEGTTS
jgi:flagellar basal-body rod protein FlgB